VADSYDKSTKLRIDINDLWSAIFRKTRDNKISVRTAASETDISLQDLLNLTLGSGFLQSESFDKIQYGINGGGTPILTYSLAGVAQFQIVTDLVSQSAFTIFKRAALFSLLQENGDKLLQENLDDLLIEGLLPL